jgi:hypothetical protein
MCGIFGVISQSKNIKELLLKRIIKKIQKFVEKTTGKKSGAYS